jgi:His-Xaa-Ser system radical SAM maturase HxsC
MIPLTLPAVAEAERAFITRLRLSGADSIGPTDSILLDNEAHGATFAGAWGLVAIDGVTGRALDGDVVLVQPQDGRADGAARVERLLRAGSFHNTLLVTERCDQLCVMCSQPPKKTHVDRFDLFEEACLLAEPDSVIGISGGEPTLYKDRLCRMIERVLGARQDLEFHVLTNGQHFGPDDIERLRNPVYRRVSWGIPLYAAEPALHDGIVAKEGAFARLEESFASLLLAGARVELRTVLLSSNGAALPALARHVTVRLRWIESWSIMQLENIGFAKNRWSQLYVDHAAEFEPIAAALDCAALWGVPARLFNFPRCTVPAAYRGQAAASISDWKRKYVPACTGCRAREDCCGFFEWHPEAQAMAGATPL